jgi:hypothetical protein
MSITEADVSRITTVLQPLQEGFAQDGGSLAVDSGGDAIRVTLVLTDASCADCLVGPEILRSIITGQLTGAGVTVPVTVIDPRE